MYEYIFKYFEKNETYVKYNYNLNLLKKKYIIKLYKCYGQNS